MNRDSYFEALRGIAIIFVVAIHSYIPPTEYSGEVTWYNITLRELLGCAVPLFFAISGYFMAKQPINTIEEYRCFIAKHVKKVYYPALFWGLFIVTYSFLNTGDFQIGYLYNVLICNVSIYYFIAIIVQFYLLSPILTNIKVSGLLICALISFLIITRVEINTIIDNNQMSYFDFRGSILTWLIFLAQGCYLGRHGRVYRLLPWLIATFITLFISVFDTIYLVEEFGRGFGMKPTTFLYSCCAIMLLFSQQTRSFFNENVISFLAKIGYFSFWIYLVHCLVMGKLAFYVVTGIVRASYVANYWLLITIAILCLTFICGYILQLALPCKLRILIGLPKERFKFGLK